MHAQLFFSLLYPTIVANNNHGIMVIPSLSHVTIYMWQSQVENEHYSTVCGLIRLVISLECLIEITPDFLYPFMND